MPTMKNAQYRPAVIEDDAFNKLITSIATATEIEVYLGKAGA